MKVFALVITHQRGVGKKEDCPIKVETIPIGCQLDGSGSRVTFFFSEHQLEQKSAGASDVADYHQSQDRCLEPSLRHQP